jgi:hypothetical protein
MDRASRDGGMLNARACALATLMLLMPSLALPPAAAERQGAAPRRDINFSNPMEFTLRHDAVGNDIIFAAGNINAETFERLQNFLHRNRIGPGAVIALHSNGGDSFAAFQLGDFIRSQSFQTIVGQQPSDAVNREGSAELIEPGICASACTFAFMGGVYREVPPDSVFIIHAASIGPSNVNPTGAAASPVHEFKSGFFEGQVFAGDLVEYLLRMGISSEFLVTYRLYDSNEQREYAVPQDALRAWNVINAEVATDWSLAVTHHLLHHRLHHRFALVGLNPPSAFAPNRREEASFHCVEPRHVTMAVAYLPPPSMTSLELLAQMRGYEVVTSDSHMRSVVQTGSEDAVDRMMLDPADILVPFHVVPPDPRIRGTIEVTPRLVGLLASNPRVVKLGFRGATGRFYGFPIDFHAVRKSFFFFLAACRFE